MRVLNGDEQSKTRNILSQLSNTGGYTEILLICFIFTDIFVGHQGVKGLAEDPARGCAVHEQRAMSLDQTVEPLAITSIGKVPPSVQVNRFQGFKSLKTYSLCQDRFPGTRL